MTSPRAAPEWYSQVENLNHNSVTILQNEPKLNAITQDNEKQ